MLNIHVFPCRTSEAIGKFLPPKTVNVVFCRASAFQAAAYRREAERVLDSLVEPGSHLAAIANLKKICNSPLLLANHESAGKIVDHFVQSFCF